MKRSELKVGEAYYHDRGQKWAAGEGYQTGKAVIVTLDRQNNGGVLVDLTIKNWRDDEVTSRAIVTLAHLRGPYEDVLAEVTKALKERHAAYDAAKAEREALHRRAEAVQQRATAAGIEVTAYRGYDSSPTFIRVSVDEFERILDRLTGNAGQVAEGS